MARLSVSRRVPRATTCARTREEESHSFDFEVTFRPSKKFRLFPDSCSARKQSPKNTLIFLRWMAAAWRAQRATAAHHSAHTTSRGRTFRYSTHVDCIVEVRVQRSSPTREDFVSAFANEHPAAAAAVRSSAPPHGPLHTPATMPKRAAAATTDKGDAKKPKKSTTKTDKPVKPAKRDQRGDDIIKLDGGDGDYDNDASAIPVAVAKSAAKKAQKKMKQNVAGAFGRDKDDRPKVLYIGHVPHGFYEDQMRAYFGQFGEVTRLRLSRNKKTGKSKHYAYCEFKHPEVAAIVAESMDNYLLFESVLKVRLMSEEEVHPELWKGANRKFKAVPWRRNARETHDKVRTDAEMAKRETKLIAGERARKRKIEKAGIEYDFPGYQAAKAGAKRAKKAGAKKSAPAKTTEKAKEKTSEKTPAKRKAAASETPAKKAKPAAKEKEKTPVKRATRATRGSK